ncbi:MAG: ATP-binding cassette domain-containing protein [Verrucomicrobia bacterium]|nr:ATP-binding cassette domain-containing protein [Verrucomicrobiota bacterium]
MDPAPVIRVENISFAYGDRMALDQVSLGVREGEIFGLLGPNGGGKTTLVPAPVGKVFLFGRDLAENISEVRRKIGVIFQSPSLDKKLTVAENLLHQGRLYGLRGDDLRRRTGEMLRRVGVGDRRGGNAADFLGVDWRRFDILVSSGLHDERHERHGVSFSWHNDAHHSFHLDFLDHFRD